ncbi:MAG: translation initiation factor IF-2 [Rickettsiales bacterium]
MSDSNEQNKLTLKPSAGRDSISARKSVMVEVKRKRVRPMLKINTPLGSAAAGATSHHGDEASKKIELIQKAKEQKEAVLKSKEEERKKAEEVAAAEAATLKTAEKPKKEFKQAEPIVKVAPKEEEDGGKFSKKLGLKTPIKKSKYEMGGRRTSSKVLIQNIDVEDEKERGRSLASIKRAREKAARKAAEDQDPSEKIVREVTLPEFITVGELASRMAERAADVIKEFMKLGMIVNAQQTVDADTAELVISEMGHKLKRITEADVENVLDITKDDNKDLKSRPPVVTVMGHVDHGKTTLLDSLRSADVAGGEAGGITQHIGAYQVKVPSGDLVTFLDTPGHEAFTQMRSRGAKVTDIVVLVVAADDGIKPQTVEALNHAKAAGVPIIVAINKMDKPEADANKVETALLSHELVTESMGGEIMAVPVSAKSKMNLDKLVDAILLQAEMLDLKANPSRSAKGSVVESKIVKGRGVVTTVLIQNGTLKQGDIVIAGHTFGKARNMTNDRNQMIKEAGPSLPVEIIGLEESPMAGDQFDVVDSEKQAREICEYRERKLKTEKNAQVKKSSLEDLFAKSTGNETKRDLPLIIKGDVQGSIEAISGSLEKFNNEELEVKVLHKGVGGINESDVTLAQASSAIIIGFNVRANTQAKILAEKENVDIRYYSIIYNLIDDMKLVMSGMLKPIIRENYLGTVEIRQVFNITKVGKIAGSYVTDGMVKKGAKVRLLRDDVVIHEGALKTLRRFKDDVKEVQKGYECGVAFENYDDIKEGDKVEVYELVEEKQKL